MPATVLVLDLDGTVLLGDAPVLAYARGLSERVVARVTAFLADPEAAIAEDPVLADAQDGYQAISRIARSMGLDSQDTREAFLRSRRELLGDGVYAPPGLAELLGTLPSYVALITNSPVDGIPEALDRLGLIPHVDRLVTEARKPSGMKSNIEWLLRQHDLTETPHHLMSVGDIWMNDLAYAHRRGCITAYVDRLDRAQGPAHLRARDLPSLYEPIRAWADDPETLLAGQDGQRDR